MNKHDFLCLWPLSLTAKLNFNVPQTVYQRIVYMFWFIVECLQKYTVFLLRSISLLFLETKSWYSFKTIVGESTSWICLVIIFFITRSNQRLKVRSRSLLRATGRVAFFIRNPPQYGLEVVHSSVIFRYKRPERRWKTYRLEHPLFFRVERLKGFVRSSKMVCVRVYTYTDCRIEASFI